MKKITYKDFRHICNYKEAHPIQAMLTYTIPEYTESYCKVYGKMPLWLYILAFIPVHVVYAIMLLWNGGLKEFEICPRLVIAYYFTNGEKSYDRAKEIYERA